VTKYEMVVDGISYEIEVEDPRAQPVKVLVNGQAFEVRVSERVTSTVSRPAPNSGPAEELEDVYVPTVASTYVETSPTEEEPAAAPPPAAQRDAGVQVTAPMPGKVLDIAVQVGSHVSQGDVLCNLEAMKMKSPIRSPTGGSVAQVLISDGQNVNFGDVLFVLQ
jgi:biotin carboxyl carrier protein